MPTVTQTGTIATLTATERVELLFEPVVRSILNYGRYSIMRGVDTEKSIAYIRQMEKILQRRVGCGFTPKGKNTIYDRKIRVNPFKAEISVCLDNLENTLFTDVSSRPAGENYAFSDPRGVPAQQLVLSMRQAIEDDIFRLFWFGDENSTDPFYNQLNGIWGHYVPELVANGDLDPIDAGSGAALQPGDGLAILKEMYYAQSKEFRGIPRQQKNFMVSSNIFDQFQEDIRALGGGDAGRMQTINGMDTPTFEGIPVTEELIWDTTAEDATGAVSQNYAILTTPRNLIIATDNESNRNVVEFWNDQTEQTSNARVQFKMGANYMHPSLMVVAQ